ncbi:MAG TPA: GDP-mannose 4,6-dehydratase [Thermoplasmata archaeon]|nr:GDP-mannose 4,6-dehydratase [Thermoplasmata archaeon]
MERALVTGGAGFLGSYMADLLVGRGVDVTSADRRPDGRPFWRGGREVRRLTLDVTDRHAVERVLDEVRPDAVFHFAGQSYIDKSWADPAHTYEVNVLGTLHLLEALRHRAPRTAFAFAGSGTEYGRPDLVPTPESAGLAPGTPYASSKTAADLLCLQYFLSSGIPVFRYRIFGTTGPGKTGDACNDFASQIVQAERGEIPPEIRVGNLDKKRDIADVRDAVRAMLLVVERGEPGEAYNIGSGKPREIRSLLEDLVGLALRPIQVVRDELRVRPVDEPVHLGDVSKLRELGFVPQFESRRTLRDILEHWRGMPSTASDREGLAEPVPKEAGSPRANGSV